MNPAQLSGESEYCLGEAELFLAISIICAFVLVAVVLAKRMRDRRELDRHSITPEALHALLASNRDVLVIDVRQPLDLLGDSVIIQAHSGSPPRRCARTLRCFRKSET
jgi:flagellar biogenesis protein FliO